MGRQPQDKEGKVPEILAEDTTYRFYSAVSKRIRDAIEQSGMSQREIVAAMESMGLAVNQGSISKLQDYKARDGNKRAPTLSFIHIVYLCKVLNLNLEDIAGISGDPMEERGIIPSDAAYDEKSRALVFDPDKLEFSGYLSDEPFYCYFYPTISSEHSLLCGRLRFTKNKARQRCDAFLEIEARQRRDADGEAVKKLYRGTLIVSIPQRSCYCILSNLEYGEICMINFHHRYFLTQHSLQCRLACAITTSAGENRRPTVHRMLITKNALSDADLKILKPQMRLNTRKIIVPKEEVDRLIQAGELPEQVAALFREGGPVAPMPYYAFDESRIQGMEIETMDRIRAISRLRDASAAPTYCKSSAKADELIFKYLNQMSKAN